MQSAQLQYPTTTEPTTKPRLAVVLKGLESLEEWDTSYSRLRTLEIYDCPKLRIKPLPPRAHWLTISKSDSVLSSWGGYTGASTTSSYPINISLRVEHCEVPMHEWRLLQHLPGLNSLRIAGCGDLTGSPDIARHLSSVQFLQLEDRDKEELPKWLGELKSLLDLEMSGFRGLKELPENMRLLTKLQLLKLSSCTSIASLPHCFGELTSLKKLKMFSCNAIRSLPEVIQQLTNLQVLEISYCSELKWWCASEENKTELTPNQERACVLPTSLKRLEIHECDAIRSLPEGIQQLTNLQELVIFGCDGLFAGEHTTTHHPPEIRNSSLPSTKNVV